MLIKTVVLGSIEIFENRSMQIREDTVITEDGVELSRTYFRYVLNPGDDVTGKPDPIPDLAALLWTIEVILAYKQKMATTLPPGA